jgi:hypothetical protein
MPAVSKNQAIAMNLANAVQKGQATAVPGSPSAQIAGSMKPAALSEFAGTPQTGLPKRVGAAPAPSMNVGGAGPGRPRMKMKKVGKPVKKMRF